jgi:hypothetical protein
MSYEKTTGGLQLDIKHYIASIRLVWKSTKHPDSKIEISYILFQGLRTRDVLCVRKDDKTNVGFEYCDQLTKPNNAEACSTQPCPPE